MKMVELPWAGNENEEFRRLLARSVSKIFDARDAGTDSVQGDSFSDNLDTAITWLKTQLSGQKVGIKPVNLKDMGAGEWSHLRKEICNAVNRVLRGNGIAHEDEVVALLGAAYEALHGGSEPGGAPVYVGDDNAVSYFYSDDPEEFPTDILGFLDSEGFRAAVPGGKLVFEDGGSNFTGKDVVVTKVSKVDGVDVNAPYTYVSGDVSVLAKDVGTNSYGSTDGRVYSTNVIELNQFPSVPTIASLSGGVGKLSFIINAGANPGTKFRVSILGAPGDGSSSAGRYEYTTAGTKTVTGLTAGSYSISIIRVWNAVGQIITAVDGGYATVS